MKLSSRYRRSFDELALGSQPGNIKLKAAPLLRTNPAGPVVSVTAQARRRCACRDSSAPITIYHIGEPGGKEHWWDLCAGPHVESTGVIDPLAVEIERVAGAYWRGDESRAMLTRVYGTAWTSEQQLAAYRHRQEEALKRDHRKLGQQLGLFSIQVWHGLHLYRPVVAHTGLST